MPVDTLPKFSKRVVISLVFTSATLHAIFFAPNWWFVVIVEVFVLFALNEFFEMAKRKGLEINSALGLVFGGLFPLTYFFPADVIIMLAAMLCIFIFNFHRRLKEQALVNTSVTMFGVIYVGWFFSLVTKIRQLPNGAAWVFYVILATKSGDIAAYFFGQKFGRTKLLQHISPNKSIEGAVASFIVSVLASVLSKSYLPHVPVGHLLFMGIVLAILALVGDLCESLIKRDCGVKDSGQIPGLGGVLDVIDSLIFTIPFCYYYVVAFPGVSG